MHERVLKGLWAFKKRLFRSESVVSSELTVNDSIFISCFQVEGSELKKVRTNSRVYQRYYLLDAGLQALCWEPSKKESDKARISLASIREVRTLSESALYERIIDSCGLTKAEEIFATLSHKEYNSWFVFIVSDVSLTVSYSRYGQVATQKPSAPAAFMSRFQRTVRSPSSTGSCMKAWTWWPTLLRWLTYGWLV